MKSVEQVHADNAKWYGSMITLPNGTKRRAGKFSADTGPAPDASAYTTAHALTKQVRQGRGGRLEGVESGFIAMCLRPHGATVVQHGSAFACRAARNKLDAIVKATPQLVTLDAVGRPFAYQLKLTARGEAVVNDYITAAQAEQPAAKAKATKAKATKAKAAPVTLDDVVADMGLPPVIEATA